MIDKSVPYYRLDLYKTDTENYPRYALPEGYEIVRYKKGDETRWAELETSLGQFKCVDDGVACFTRDFLCGQNLDPEERVFFVRDKDGEYVATAALWNGKFLGEEHQRIHWVAVSDRCSGKGIAKAMLTHLMDYYNSLGYSGFIYLVTGTRNYPAISIYRKFGFIEYRGPRSVSADLTDEQYAEQTEKAIAIVNKKLKQYNAK